MKTTETFKKTVETGGTYKSAKQKEKPVKNADGPTESAKAIHAKIQHKIKEAYNRLEKKSFHN